MPDDFIQQLEQFINVKRDDRNRKSAEVIELKKAVKSGDDMVRHLKKAANIRNGVDKP